MKQALLCLGRWNESKIDAAIKELVSKVTEERESPWDMDQTILARLDQMERKMDETLAQMGPTALAVYYNSQEFLSAVQERVRQTVKEMEPKIIEKAVEARLKRDLVGDEKELYEKRLKLESDKMRKQFHYDAVKQTLTSETKKYTAEDFLAGLSGK
jgi:DNA primase large subunit